MGKVIKAFLDEGISLTVIDSKDIVCEAMSIHSFSPVACVAFGRAITVCTMMGTELKSETDSMTAVISGDGALGKITVCVDSKGNSKGYVENPNAESFYDASNKPDVSRAVGKNGRLTVVKSMGLREPYVGSSKLYNGEVTDDFASYFYHSEQCATAVTVGIVMDGFACEAAFGVLMRVLPDCPSEVVDKFNSFLTEAKNINYLCKDIECLIERLFAKFSIRIISESKSVYLCDCGRERIERVILSMSRAEIFNILVEQGKIELVCDFCRKKYVYDKDSVVKLLNPSVVKS